MTIILDPGHGMSNKRSGQFDPGAVSNGVREADIAMDWCNELRGILMEQGHKVIRTRQTIPVSAGHLVTVCPRLARGRGHQAQTRAAVNHHVLASLQLLGRARVK